MNCWLLGLAGMTLYESPTILQFFWHGLYKGLTQDDVERLYTTNDILQVRELTLDLPGMRAVFGGTAVELTKNEVRILRCLMQKEVCTREELIEDLWTNGMYIYGNTLYVNIGRLREKLGQIGATDFIRTVRGVGYRL